MKKTVQINIAGVLFAIEEDAFDKLNNYLKSIQNYFAAFESSEEIVADIEARIAERFMKDETDSSTIILTTDDVEAVITRMGSVADFQAMEEEVDFKEEAAPQKTETSKESNFNAGAEAQTVNKKLHRDTKRKALGGVLAGFAHYFKLDVTWIRVIFALLFLGITPLTATGGSAVLLLAYVICWIAVPGSDNLEISDRIKRFYRNPDGKVIGGVATGLSSYFNVDVAVVRVLFVVFGFFFGIGILAYLVVWVGSPLASSITQKMELQGEPVTLENIENSVRRNLGVKDEKSENTLSKILLFPFRIISLLFSGLGNLLKHLGPVARVVAGLFITGIGLAMLFGAIVATGAFFGVTSNHDLFDFGSNVGRLFGEIPKTSGIFLFLATAFPGLAAMLAGFSLLSNRRVGSRNFWLTAVVLWVAGIFGLAIYGTDYSMNFAKKDTVVVNEEIKAPMQNLFFDVNEMEWDREVRFDTHLRFEKSDNGQLEIEKAFEARGSNREVARENAAKIKYGIETTGDTLVFDQQIRLGDDEFFRNQALDLTVKIPEGVTFRVSPRFARELMSQSRSIRYSYGISSDRISEITFIMDSKGELTCVDCPDLSDEEKEALNDNSYRSEDRFFFDSNNDLKNYGSRRLTFDFKDFDELEFEAAIMSEIRQGDEYSIEVIAERQRDLDDLDVDLNGDVLSFEYVDAFFKNRDDLLVVITMPTIERLELSGACKSKVLNFENLDRFEADVSGASKVALDLDVKRMNVDASGACNVQLAGDIDNLSLSASGATKVNAKRAKIKTARVEASGASSVNLGDVEKLDSETSGASKVSRR